MNKTIKIVCISLVLAFLACTIAFAGASVKTGDVDLNGKVNSKDYVILKRHCLGTFKLEGDALHAGDINGDGKVNSKDYALLKRYCLGTYELPDDTSENESKETSKDTSKDTSNTSGIILPPVSGDIFK